MTGHSDDKSQFETTIEAEYVINLQKVRDGRDIYRCPWWLQHGHVGVCVDSDTTQYGVVVTRSVAVIRSTVVL